MKKAGRPVGNKAASGGGKGDTVTAGTSAGKSAVKSPTTAPLSKVTSLSCSNYQLVFEIYNLIFGSFFYCYFFGDSLIFDQQVKSDDDLLAAMAGSSAGTNSSVAKGKKSTHSTSCGTNTNNPDTKTKTNSGI